MNPPTDESATPDEFRPCHGCGRHYTACVCGRKPSSVTFKLQCPYCWYEFQIGAPERARWLQRCGQCWRVFDAINPAKENPPDATDR